MYRTNAPPPPEPPAPKRRKPIKIKIELVTFVASLVSLGIIFWKLPDIGFRGSDAVYLMIPEIVAIPCMVHLWRRNARWYKRLFWSPVLLLPVIGPLLYGALFEPPEPQIYTAGGGL